MAVQTVTANGGHVCPFIRPIYSHSTRINPLVSRVNPIIPFLCVPPTLLGRDVWGFTVLLKCASFGTEFWRWRHGGTVELADGRAKPYIPWRFIIILSYQDADRY